AAALVGRDAPLAAIERLYEEARAGHGRVLLLEGEAGIGKTRLLDAFVAWMRTREEPVAVLYGSNPPGALSAGLGALRRAVVDHLGEADLEARLAEYLPSATRLVPAFTALLRGEPLASGVDPIAPEAIHAAFCQLARRLAARQPLVWIVDDV